MFGEGGWPHRSGGPCFSHRTQFATMRVNHRAPDNGEAVERDIATPPRHLNEIAGAIDARSYSVRLSMAETESHARLRERVNGSCHRKSHGLITLTLACCVNTLLVASTVGGRVATDQMPTDNVVAGRRGNLCSGSF